MQNGQPAVVDYLEYASLPADQSFGYPEPAGAAGAVPMVLPVPTSGGANAGAWQDLGGVTATTSEARFTDTASDGVAQRFYRVLLVLR